MDYQIFISHSSKNNAEAKKLLSWLEENGWQNVFLDLDPSRGIQAGDKWQKKLRDACFSCEAILFLLTNNWLNSKWCLAEYLLAKQLGKLCIPLIIEDVDWNSIPIEMRAEHQIVDLRNEGGKEQLQSGLLIAGIAANTFEFPDDRSPFRGLQTLTEDDAAVFFGRDAEIVRAIDQVRRMISSGTEKLMVILGPSGSGKSSLMRAGVWPRLKRNQFEFLPLPIVRPGVSPLSGSFGLYAAIEGAASDPDLGNRLSSDFPKTRGAIKEFASTDREKLISLLKQLQSAAGSAMSSDRLPKLVLCLDQCEELYTQDSNECDEFRQILGYLISEMESLFAITTIRTNSYPLLQRDQLLDASLHSPFNLGPMKSWQYKDVIEGPAQVADVKIAPELVDAMLEDTKGADALPLLAFTLERLNSDFGKDGDLTKAEYDQMGGISGSVSIAVSECLNRVPVVLAKYGKESEYEQKLNLTKSTFVPRLVGIDSSGAFCRKIAEKKDFPKETIPILTEFVSSRLLIENGPSVEIAHEAIFRNWPAMKGWLGQEKEFLNWHDGLSRAIEAHSIGDRGLLTGKELDIAEKWALDRNEQLPSVGLDFIDTSVDERDQRQKRKQFWNRIIACGYVLASIGILAFAVRSYWAERDAKIARDDANAKAIAEHIAKEEAQKNASSLRELNQILETGQGLRIAVAKGPFIDVGNEWYPTANRSLRASIRISTESGGGSGFLAKGSLFRKDFPPIVIVTSAHVVNETNGRVSAKASETYFQFFSDLDTDRRRQFGNPLWNSESNYGVSIYGYDGELPKFVEVVDRVATSEYLTELKNGNGFPKIALLHGNYQGSFVGFGMSRVAELDEGGDYPTIRSFYASERGVSGAPVFDCASGNLIGIHQAGARIDSTLPDEEDRGIAVAVWIQSIINEVRTE